MTAAPLGPFAAIPFASSTIPHPLRRLEYMRRAMAILAGAIAGGVLFCLAVPPGEAGWLAWITFVPVLAATMRTRFLVGFAAGLAMVALAAACSVLGWPYRETSFEGNAAWTYTGFGLFSFSIALAFGFWSEKGLADRPPWLFAALATLLEAVLLLKLPAHVALSQWRSVGPLQLCALGGVWLLSFFIWWANFALARALSERSWRPFGLAALLVGALYGFGWFVSNAKSTEATVAVLQVGELESDHLAQWHRRLSRARPTFAVWPEFAGIAFGGSDPTQRLRSFAAEAGVAPFVTTFGDGALPMPHNAAALFSEQGESVRYWKRKPFGGETAMYAAGARPGAVGAPFYVGLNICFDSCFNGVLRDTVALGDVRVIALPSIDPQAPHGFLAANHAAFSAIRSAELGIPIAKADGFGYSCVTDSYGRFLTLHRFGEGYSVASVAQAHWTPARQLGDGLLYGLAGLAVAGWVRKRSARSPVGQD